MQLSDRPLHLALELAEPLRDLEDALELFSLVQQPVVLTSRCSPRLLVVVRRRISLCVRHTAISRARLAMHPAVTHSCEEAQSLCDTSSLELASRWSARSVCRYDDDVSSRSIVSREQ